jgi:hypothetical protein
LIRAFAKRLPRRRRRRKSKEVEAFVAKNLPAASSKLTGTNVVVAAAAVDSYTAVGFVVAAGFGKRR